jgi:integrase
MTSTKTRKQSKTFPLFLHRSGQWTKKIKGKHFYFGADREAALAKYLDEKDLLLAGRPRPEGDGLTVADLCNRYLSRKRSQVESGELSPRTWATLHRVCAGVVQVYGKNQRVAELTADDFAVLRERLAKDLAPVSLGIEIQRIKGIFKFGYDDGLLDKPIRYGAAFNKPSRKVLRQARAERGARMFEAAELRKVIDAAGIPLKAMVLLALNGGLTQADVAALPISAIKDGFLDFPRIKTAIPRRIPLWKETAASLTEALAKRPEPKDAADAGLVFLTKYGKPWITVKFHDEGKRDVLKDSVRLEFNKVLTDLGLKRAGSFGSLRHVFRTVADGARDTPAVNSIMGHSADTNDMSQFYRERIEDERLVAVVAHVRAWLFKSF